MALANSQTINVFFEVIYCCYWSPHMRNKFRQVKTYYQRPAGQALLLKISFSGFYLFWSLYLLLQCELFVLKLSLCIFCQHLYDHNIFSTKYTTTQCGPVAVYRGCYQVKFIYHSFVYISGNTIILETSCLLQYLHSFPELQYCSLLKYEM